MGSMKFIEEQGEREGDKLGEIIRENAEAAAVGSLDHSQQHGGNGDGGRASLSQVLKSESQNKEEVDEIINTRVVNIADLTGKSDAEVEKDLDKMKKGDKRLTAAER